MNIQERIIKGIRSNTQYFKQISKEKDSIISQQAEEIAALGRSLTKEACINAENVKINIQQQAEIEQIRQWGTGWFDAYWSLHEKYKAIEGSKPNERTNNQRSVDNQDTER